MSHNSTYLSKSIYSVVWYRTWKKHYRDIIMSMMESQITGASIVYLTVCSGTDQRKHQSFASLAFVRGIHWWPVNSPQKMFPFNDVIMQASFGNLTHILSCHNYILHNWMSISPCVYFNYVTGWNWIALKSKDHHHNITANFDDTKGQW